MVVHLLFQFFIDSVSEVDKICLPIKNLGIIFFMYLKNFNDGSQINFSNNSNWIYDYYRFKLYKNNLFENNPCTYKTGFFIWPHINDFLNNLQFVESKQNNYLFGNGLTIIEPQLNCCEFFSFSGHMNDNWLINFYINNLNVLKKFTIYFKYLFNNNLKKAERKKITIPRTWNNLKFKKQEILYGMQNEISKSKKIMDKELFKNANHHKLSNREKDVIQYLSCGRTSKEIGKLLRISHRTVEKHLENIKLKFNCNTKIEVINNINLVDL